MTSRAGKPDTPADVELRECLDAGRSFVMVAGAGSGKTTSLVKALDHIGRSSGAKLRRSGQKIACITYTEIAKDEIWGDVGNDPLFHVSTIHSFLWSLVAPFQNDVREWTLRRIEARIAELEETAANFGPRTLARTREKNREDILRYQAYREPVAHVGRFTYGTGSDYPNGILGHDDILRMGAALIGERPLLRSLFARKYPVVFVDESQDTNPEVVDALIAVDRQEGEGFCLGFFGDPMQKIYTSGYGAIPCEPGWKQITKPENFRCPTSVLEIVNRIRADGDGLVQVPGREAARGTARIFILPADGLRSARLRSVRRWMSEANGDPLWLDDGSDGDVRVLVIVHRMAALRLGFGDLYAAMNDRAPSSLKDGFLDGTSWAVRPFLDYLLPLADAVDADDGFGVVSLLKANCPKMAREAIADTDPAALLTELRTQVQTLAGMLSETGDASVGDVVRFVHETRLTNLDERFLPYLAGAGGGANAEDNDEVAAMAAYFDFPAKQLRGYRTYIEDESPFATHQGIKGAEFERVLAVLDDSEGRHNQFSYEKLFGIAPPSKTDEQNAAEGKETVLDRTRRLFYVCCSRAVRDLAVALFSSDVPLAERKIKESEIFPEDCLHVLDEPPDA